MPLRSFGIKIMLVSSNELLPFCSLFLIDLLYYLQKLPVNPLTPFELLFISTEVLKYVFLTSDELDFSSLNFIKLFF